MQQQQYGGGLSDANPAGPMKAIGFAGYHWSTAAGLTGTVTKAGSLLQQSTRNHPGVAVHGYRARSPRRSTGTIWRKIQPAMW